VQENGQRALALLLHRPASVGVIALKLATLALAGNGTAEGENHERVYIEAYPGFVIWFTSFGHWRCLFAFYKTDSGVQYLPV
jgi:hypothetical protein